jgi:hypothetical protein
MAHDASEILGAPQLAGVKVNPRGFGRRAGANFTGGNAGLIGAAVSAAAVDRANKKKAEAAAASSAPDFGRIAYLAVTADELALIELKQKSAVTLELREVIARIPRSEVASAELGGGHTLMSPPLTITFTNGDVWLIEVPRPNKKQAQQLVGVLMREGVGI